jgi:hypothetical protein
MSLMVAREQEKGIHAIQNKIYLEKRLGYRIEHSHQRHGHFYGDPQSASDLIGVG